MVRVKKTCSMISQTYLALIMYTNKLELIKTTYLFGIASLWDILLRSGHTRIDIT